MLLHLLPACPVDGKLSSPWGRRQDPITGRVRKHGGLDLAAPIGTPIQAMWEGTVARARSFPGGYGNYAIIESGSFRVLYAHMSERKVEAGDKVTRGQVIGAVGETGRATGPHLHLAVWVGRRNKNPMVFLSHCPIEPMKRGR